MSYTDKQLEYIGTPLDVEENEWKRKVYEYASRTIIEHLNFLESFIVKHAEKILRVLGLLIGGSIGILFSEIVWKRFELSQYTSIVISLLCVFVGLSYGIDLARNRKILSIYPYVLLNLAFLIKEAHLSEEDIMRYNVLSNIFNEYFNTYFKETKFFYHHRYVFRTEFKRLVFFISSREAYCEDLIYRFYFTKYLTLLGVGLIEKNAFYVYYALFKISNLYNKEIKKLVPKEKSFWEKLKEYQSLLAAVGGALISAGASFIIFLIQNT